MITHAHLHRIDAGVATHYYSEQKDDYYGKDAGAAQWQGKGAQMLGLQGNISPMKFQALLRGDFGMGIEVNNSVRKDGRARAAIDLTFSAPKSISIQGIIGKDHAVIAAHDKAVTEALAYIEKNLSVVRGKEDGQTYREVTGNLVVAKWRHETARPTTSIGTPTDDNPPDPQLHTHALIMNIARRSDGVWVALDTEQIVRLKKLLDSIYKMAMARELQRAGYAIRYEKDNIELAHISRPQIEVFSKRKAVIDKTLLALGLDRRTATAAQKQFATLKTRLSKPLEYTRDTLQAGWSTAAKAAGIDFEAYKLKQFDHQRQIDDIAHDDLAHEGHPGNASSSTPQVDNAPGHRGPEQVRPGAIQPAHVDTTPAPQPASSAGAQDLQSQQDISLNPGAAGASQTAAPSPNLIAMHGIQWAIKHLSERESVMTRTSILVAANNHIRAAASMDELEIALDQLKIDGQVLGSAALYRAHRDPESQGKTRATLIRELIADGVTPELAKEIVTKEIVAGNLVPADARYTTPALYAKEQEILAIEARGRGAVQAVYPQAVAAQLLESSTLTPGQRTTAEMILTTGNRVIGVQGTAGTGKTHTLETVIPLLQQQGYKVLAVASYGQQKQELAKLGKDLAKFNVVARTLASVFEARDKSRFKFDEKTIVVVDEAGVIPTRLMQRTLSRIEKAGVRAVLLGDIAQTKAIESGRPFHQLQDAGMQTAKMEDIRRQKSADHREAVTLASKGQGNKALKLITNIHQVEDEVERYEAIATHYAGLAPHDRQETLILTGTNDSRMAINQATRQALGLQGTGFMHELLVRRDTTQAERRHVQYYNPDEFIEPERDYASGLKQGELYRIIGAAGPRQLRVQNVRDGTEVVFFPSRTFKISVYALAEMELAAGDSVKVTRNHAAKDLANGNRFEVQAVTPTTVTLTDGKRTVELAADAPMHLDLAYATTSHSAQGLTKDCAIVNVESYTRTTKADTFYVNLSRHRNDVHIYTNDKFELPDAVLRQELKTAALDLELDAQSLSSAQKDTQQLTDEYDNDLAFP